MGKTRNLDTGDSHPTSSAISHSKTNPADGNNNKNSNQSIDTQQKKTSSFESQHQNHTNDSATIHTKQTQDQRIHPKTNHQFPKISSNFDKATRSDGENRNNTCAAEEIQNSVPNQAITNITKPHPPSQMYNPNQNASISNITSTPHNRPSSNISKPSFASTVAENLIYSLQGKQPVDIAHGTHMGKPAVYFSAQDYFVNLAQDCRFTLVGKLTKGKPSMNELRKLFNRYIPLIGSVKIAYFDPNHVYIDFANETDFYHIYFKPFVTLGSYTMKIIRWTPDFVPENESSLAPVWILIHQLPWHLFRWDILSKMVSSIGSAMAPDMATYSKSRGNVAKLKVEIDLLKPRQDQIWVCFKRFDSNVEDGYWLDVEYEGAPSYCQYCLIQGHSQKDCRNKKRDADLKEKSINQITQMNSTNLPSKDDAIYTNA